jgi:ribose 5-phosphate isomerase
MSSEQEKQLATEAAADLVEHGMTVGLGTGSTVAFLLPALARRSLGILCAATSPRTEHAGTIGRGEAVDQIAARYLETVSVFAG